MPRAKNTTTGRLAPAVSFGGAAFSRASNSPSTKTTKIHRDGDGNKRTESVDLKGDQNVKQDRLQLSKFRGFNQAKPEKPESYFKKNAPRCESEPDYKKFPGKEVR